ncbi:class I SAM-dependent RNA methyltransferase [Mycobacterium talmoniae]|uniref:23S rRNA methyltransferase n=1 Tax=Mycobacterium talmoniae TaxID=1858794 RepID=A0A1S1NFU8_9MYCO|nr:MULTISPECIES: TRAM domain-containing protein [Mycobacterium]OHV00465.1 23S rRNA methyltransferase [Mycobacterium talmoniae]TDH48827.1 class I SAM-dependent RNA methyltransferase [Mycobacterium eburneum]
MTPGELTLTVGPPANGGSCVARHDGRVVFVRYALPGERVRARITAQRESYWHAEAVEVLEPSADRIASACPIAGRDGAGCCDLAFVEPAAARALKAEVVSGQLARLGGHQWHGETEPVGTVGTTGWRTRVRLAVGADGHAGFHRYHSDELVTDLRCGQLPDGMLDGLPHGFSPGDQVHVVVDDNNIRHVVTTARHRRPEVVEGDYHATQRVGGRRWQLPVTAFWQAHREGARVYSDLVADWAQPGTGATAWDLYGGAGVFAAVLGQAVGESGRVVTVDTSRAAAGAARAALADLPQVRVVTDSVRRALAAQRSAAEVAVLDPPRAGAGREVIDLLAGAAVSRVVHIGCEAASFARDIGLYRQHGYTVEQLRVFDAFPLTHHVECVALLIR